jgi:hypothetical protein
MTKGVKPHRAALLVVAALAIGAIALPVSATASFDRHFTVISKDVRGHETTNGFAFRIVLLNPFNTANQVGYGHAKCRAERGDRKVRCRVFVHLDGTIGGFGDLIAKGNIGRGDNSLQIVDGTGDFGGEIAGKVIVHRVNDRKNPLEFSLTR